MTCACTRKERRQYLWSGFVVTTFIVCCVLLILSLKYTGNYGRQNPTYTAKSEKLTDDECKHTCYTKDCVLHANFLNSQLDPNVDPCENFYSFSCGKYKARIGKDENASNFEYFSVKHWLELKDLLDNLEADPETASGKMKKVYDSCVDISSSELVALSSAYEFLGKIGLHNWPNIHDDFEFTNPNLSEVLGILTAYREFSFLKFITLPYDGKQIYNISIERLSHLNERNLYASQIYSPSLMSAVLQYFEGKDVEDIKNVTLFFSSYYQKLETTDCNAENATDLYIDCSAEVDRGWKMLCDMKKTFMEVVNVTAEMSKDIIYIPCEKIDMSTNTLDIFQEVPHRSIAYFLGFSFLLSHLEDLSLPLRLLYEETELHIEGKDIDYEKTPFNRWHYCVHWIAQNMPFPLGSEYVRKVITEPVFRQAHDMFQEGFEESEKMIEELQWLTNDQKSEILKEFEKYRVLSTELQMMYYLNDTFLNEYYKQFHPTRKSFLNNVLERQRASFTTDMVYEWQYPVLHQLKAFSFNARFLQKVIDLGLANFRFPTIELGTSRTLNLIRLSAVTGHEVGHLIQQAFGNILDKKLISSEIHPAMNECFEMQYSNFTIESLGKKVDTILTASENFADSVSIMLVDRIIEKYVSNDITSNEFEKYALPSLPYTMKQLIYIMLSEIMCSKYTKEKEELLNNMDFHSLDRFRITAMMQNSKGFSRTNNCSAESYMNPVNKCQYIKPQFTTGELLF